MYFLNMYSLFNLKSGIAELQVREDKVSLEQYLVIKFFALNWNIDWNVLLRGQIVFDQLLQVSKQ